MKSFKKMRKFICGLTLLCLSLALLLPAGRVSAEANNGGLGYIDTTKTGNLKIYYNFSGYGDMAGVKAHIYRIADVSKTGEFTVVAPFNTLGLNITDMTSISTHEQWKAITDTLSIYVKNNSVQEYATATSGNDGFADLGSVATGLYYGYSDPIEIDGTRYVYYDVIAPVPGPVMLDETGRSDWDGTWTNAPYDVIAIPKRESTRVEGDPEEYTIFKQWNDKGHSDDRPVSINVKNYCDGALFETVQLSSSNNWQYSWKHEKGHKFTVEEEVDSEKYTVTVSQNETGIVIVNSRNPEKKEEKPPTETPPTHTEEGHKEPQRTETPPNTENESPSVLGAVRELLGELPAVLGARRLAQTGQLWWPIPVLAIAGIILILHGIRSERRRKSREV